MKHNLNHQHKIKTTLLKQAANNRSFAFIATLTRFPVRILDIAICNNQRYQLVFIQHYSAPFMTNK